MPSNRIGLFQRKLGTTGATSTGWAIDYTVSNANSAIFSITSNITVQPTVNYTINGLESGMINESLSGTITLDANGDATLPITLIPSANVGTDSSFNLELTNPITHVSLVSSSNIEILSVPNISMAGGTTSTANSNVLHKFYSTGTLEINNLRVDPWIGTPVNLNIVACGGGSAGRSYGKLYQFSGGTYYGAGGGGAGGEVVQSTISTTELTVGNANVIVGQGATSVIATWDNLTPDLSGGNTSILGQGFNVTAYGGTQSNRITLGGSAYRLHGGTDVEVDAITGSIGTGGNWASNVVSSSNVTKVSGGGAGQSGNGDDAVITTVSLPQDIQAGNAAQGIYVQELGTLGSGGGGAVVSLTSTKVGIGGTNAGNGGWVRHRFNFRDKQNGTSATDGFGGGGGGGTVAANGTNLGTFPDYNLIAAGGDGGDGVVMISYPESQGSPQYRVFLQN